MSSASMDVIRCYYVLMFGIDWHQKLLSSVAYFTSMLFTSGLCALSKPASQQATK